MQSSKSGDYIRPMKVMEVLGAGRYRCFYGGAHYEVFAPSAASLSVGDLVMARVMRRAGELFVPKVAALGEVVFYGVPIMTGDTTQSEIWTYDGTTPTLRHTTTATVGLYGAAHVTCMFYLPAAKTVYFNLHVEYTDDTDYVESNHLYAMNPTTYAVTNLGLSGSFDVDADPTHAYEEAPPICDAAYFKGYAYLCQACSKGGLSGNFKSRVYRFNAATPSVTKVFTHDGTGTEFGKLPSGLAVYGNDQELLFAGSFTCVGSGRLFRSTDGTTWTMFQDLGDNDETYSLMTDRTTGKVYLCHVDTLGAKNVWVYAGTSFTVDATFPAGWQQPILGATYNGIVRQYLWDIDRINGAADEVYNNSGAGWAADTLQPGAAILWYWNNMTQGISSSAGEPLMLHCYPLAGAIGVRLYRRAITGWAAVHTINRTFPICNHDINGAICRAGTAVLPHEQ